MLQWHEFLCCGEGLDDSPSVSRGDAPQEVPLEGGSEGGGMSGLDGGGGFGGPSGISSVQFDGKGRYGRVVPVELQAVTPLHVGRDAVDSNRVKDQRRRASEWVGALSPRDAGVAFRSRRRDTW